MREGERGPRFADIQDALLWPVDRAVPAGGENGMDGVDEEFVSISSLANLDIRHQPSATSQQSFRPSTCEPRCGCCRALVQIDLTANRFQLQTISRLLILGQQKLT